MTPFVTQILSRHRLGEWAAKEDPVLSSRNCKLKEETLGLMHGETKIQVSYSASLQILSGCSANLFCSVRSYDVLFFVTLGLI
jgi:hypothetical protein